MKLSAKIFIFISLLIIGVGSSALAGKVVLPEETEIKVKFDPNMIVNSGKLQPGIPLLIFLEEDIKVGGKTIVEAGATGKAEVVEVVKASKPGKPGFIKIAFTELEPKGAYKTADNAKIKIAGFAEGQGKGKKLLSYIFFFGLILKGGQGEIDARQSYPAIIKETIILEN